MTKDEIEPLIRGQFDRWAPLLAAKVAVPTILISFVQAGGPIPDGSPIVLAPHLMSNAEVLSILERILEIARRPRSRRLTADILPPKPGDGGTE